MKKPKKSHRSTAEHHRTVELKEKDGKWTCDCVACRKTRAYYYRSVKL